MGSKCCKTIHGGIFSKAEDTLVDYKGKYINLEKEFSALSDTESEEELQLEKPLLNKQDSSVSLTQKNLENQSK